MTRSVNAWQGEVRDTDLFRSIPIQKLLQCRALGTCVDCILQSLVMRTQSLTQHRLETTINEQTDTLRLGTAVWKHSEYQRRVSQSLGNLPAARSDRDQSLSVLNLREGQLGCHGSQFRL